MVRYKGDITPQDRGFEALSPGRSRGSTLLEYVILVGFVALVCVGAMQVVGRRMSESFSRVASGFDTNP
jgi:Flp pilus assembly pilin Flp